MKKKIYLILTVLILLSVFLIFKPRPLCDSGIDEIIRFEINYNYGEEDSILTDAHFSPDKLIECLSKYKEHRTLSMHKGYSMKDVQMSIMLRTDKNIKEIIIGKDIYCRSDNGLDFKIINAEQFKQELFDTCGYIENTLSEQ